LHLFGKDRFSEDLDFSLLKPRTDFRLEAYHKAVQNELDSYGMKSTVTEKRKTEQSAIQSAFIKTGTSEYDVKIKLDSRKMLTVKFELDVDPPGNFVTESRYALNPTEFYVRTYSLQDLFIRYKTYLLGKCMPFYAADGAIG